MQTLIFGCRLLKDAAKTARIGEPAPNPLLHNVRTGEVSKLLDLIAEDEKMKDLPMVINFGSCT